MMWVEFEVEFGAIPLSGNGLVVDKVDVEIFVAGLGGKKAIPFEAIWDEICDAADEELRDRYAMSWVRFAEIADDRFMWAAGGPLPDRSYGVLEDDLIEV